MEFAGIEPTLQRFGDVCLTVRLKVRGAKGIRILTFQIASLAFYY